jgi:RimJ/RimL family protein N-acetyltransferase
LILISIGDINSLVKEPSTNLERLFINLSRGKGMEPKEISLRLEIKFKDANKIINWLGNKEVSKYLNEDKDQIVSLQDLILNNETELLQYRLNQDGRFFLIDKNNESIGFLNLFTIRKYKEYEVVIAIGDPENWGHKYGRMALENCMREVFFKWRIEKLNVKVDKMNLRSVALFEHLSYEKVKENDKYYIYQMTFDKYLSLLN